MNSIFLMTASPAPGGQCCYRAEISTKSLRFPIPASTDTGLEDNSVLGRDKGDVSHRRVKEKLKNFSSL